jgi:hypothetical protein
MSNTFKQFMRDINTSLQNTLGVTTRSLADYYYRDAYDAGASPEETAIEVVRNDLGDDAAALVERALSGGSR